MIRHLIALMRDFERLSLGDVGGALVLFLLLFIGAGWVAALQVAP